MIYATSDLHGCLTDWRKMLDVISFTDTDEMYVLGDIIDRGSQPIALLQDLMARPNVFPLLGNHEYEFMQCVSKLPSNATIDDFMIHLDAEALVGFTHWINDGGRVTFEQYMALPPDERADILDYIDEFSLCEILETTAGKFVLTHSGLMDFDASRDLDDYEVHQFLFDRPTLESRYFADKKLIIGHTPTLSYGEQYAGKILKKASFINIDCGCVFRDAGGRLACLRLDDLQEFYIWGALTRFA